MKVKKHTNLSGEQTYSFQNNAANLNGEDNILIEATSFEQAIEIYQASKSLDDEENPLFDKSVWKQFKFKK